MCDTTFNDDIAVDIIDTSLLVRRSEEEWGVCAHRSDNSETSLWGPVVTDPAAFNWVGAPRPTNNFGEISAIYHALKWFSGSPRSMLPVLLTDSVFCVCHFGENSVKARCNKPIIQRVRQLFHDVRQIIT